ncbi:MAG: pyridoxal-phosphate dependent enzyme [Acidimicrobiia bacterium]|nr:pyridoxal-phosphate dependent enzyme [Acidimicrobiia bacterium]
MRYREMLHPYGFARRRGLSDSDYVTLVRDLDDAVAAVDGHGFRLTPFGFAPDLDARLALEPATTLVKDETDNVSGSHKGRHLFGLALQITLAGRFGALDRWPPRLAIASCGNAALAAAVVARAARWPLSVFVPPTANEFVLGRLDALGAEVVECPRVPGDPPGDPCVRRFRAAVAAGALPFSCQGPENGLTVDGGRTLAYEIVDGLRAAQLGAGAAAPIPAVDAPGGAALGRDVCLYVQVGGGAMAAGLAAGFEDAAALGCLGRTPDCPGSSPCRPRVRRRWPGRIAG